jgi:magnesium-transporting ATPase (P-type)
LKSLLDFKDMLTEENTLCVIPFTRESKRGSIVVRNPDLAGTSHEVRVYCKGAPDFFLMENSESNDMSYPELTSVQTEDGVYDL